MPETLKTTPENTDLPAAPKKQPSAEDMKKYSEERNETLLELAQSNEKEEKERTQENTEQDYSRAWASLDEKGEHLTAIHENQTTALITEIEAKFPELKHFASEQYC